MTNRNARAIAAKLLAKVAQGQSLTQLLAQLDSPEKGFIQALCFGVLREHETLSWQLSQLLDRALPKNKSTVHALCLLGLYQLQDGQTPDYVAINETVKTLNSLKENKFKGLVNAILRRFQREKSALQSGIELSDARFNCPEWLLKTLQKDWPDNWQFICKAQQTKPPMTLRVNLSKTSREDFQQSLSSENINAYAGTTESCLFLEQAIDVYKLPGFEQASVSVQDQAGQLIPSLLSLKPEMRILDACSAPGSKLAHLFEVCPDAHFTAIDVDDSRITRLHQTIERHNITANVICTDAADLDAWWDKQPFDLILLDAPCSATGVIRRHPDIKRLRKPNDISALQQTQLQLLSTLWKTLAPGGQLLYTTCSVLPEENDEVIDKFLSTHQATASDFSLPIGRKTQHGWQILPGEENCDGFYFALIVFR